MNANNDPMRQIDEARVALNAAKRAARRAWAMYSEIESARGYESRAARAQGATHLPEDMLVLLEIDRYGGARVRK